MVFLKVEKSSPYFSRFQVRSWQLEAPKTEQLRFLASPAPGLVDRLGCCLGSTAPACDLPADV